MSEGMSGGMSVSCEVSDAVVMSSAMDALRDENKRLKSDLNYYQKCCELYENYRKCLLYFDNNCVCIQNKDFYFVIESLEMQYKTLLRQDMQFTYQLIQNHSQRQAIDGHMNANAVNESFRSSIQNTFQDIMVKTEDTDDSSDDLSADDSLDSESSDECQPNPMGDAIWTPKKASTARSRNPKPYVCDWIGCEKTFRDNIALKAHIRLRHTNERPFACDKCDKSFADKKHLTQHLKYHNSDEKFKCKYSDCPFETRHPKNLSEHYVRHSKVRNFKCSESECGKSFITKKDLKRHQSTVHSDERPYGCDWPGCEASFKNRQHWNNHRLTHSGVRQFKCDFIGCQKSFVTRNTLFQHKQEHIKPYICVWPACGQRFGNNRSLKTHINEHQGVRPFKCHHSGCYQCFYSKPQLNQHMKSAHKSTFNAS